MHAFCIGNCGRDTPIQVTPSTTTSPSRRTTTETPAISTISTHTSGSTTTPFNIISTSATTEHTTVTTLSTGPGTTSTMAVLTSTTITMTAVTPTTTTDISTTSTTVVPTTTTATDLTMTTTTPSATTTTTPSAITTTTLSKTTTTNLVSTTTSPDTAPTTTMVPATTTVTDPAGTAVTTSSTTTSSASTTTVTPRPCPLTLSEAAQTENLIVHNYTRNTLRYNLFVASFQTPLKATAALLLFEFQTESVSWRLDDVSLKKQGSAGDEVLQNGNFENGMFGLAWEYCYPKESYVGPYITEELPYTGRYCFASRSTGNFSEYLSQEFAIESNTWYHTEFYAYSMNEFDLLTVSVIFHWVLNESIVWPTEALQIRLSPSMEIIITVRKWWCVTYNYQNDDFRCSKNISIRSHHTHHLP